MATTGFVLYLLCVSSMAILSTYSLRGGWTTTEPNHELVYSTSQRVWPKLEFGWRAVVATLIGFTGSAFGTVGGVGGGGIFVPMLTLIVGFDTKSAAAISKCMIMGASTSSVWYNLRVQHPTKEAPILDYDLALLFQPVLLLGITFGVALSVVFPYWLITLFIIILFLGTSSRAFYKGIQMWKQETVAMKQSGTQLEEEAPVSSHGELQIGVQNEPLIPREEKSQMQVICLNLNWKMMSALLFVWVSFLLIQIFKNNVAVCSVWYWVLFCLQLPIALAVFGYESTKLYREDRRRMCMGNTDAVCEATIQWTAGHIAFCAVCGLVGGCVGGLLGSGGGFVLGPLLLELGVIPQVASATATFVMMFSSSLSVVEFYLLKRFPIPYAVYLMTVSILAGFWGQYLIRKLITVLGKASIIVFILSGVIFVSALTMGVVGIEKSISMIRDHEFMGFLSFCSSQ